MTEVWFRNPVTYIRECAELLVPRIAWDRGFLVKKGIEAQKHLELHYPSAVDYRLLLVGDQGTAELRDGYPITAPYAVYPTWSYDVATLGDLEDILDNPPGMDLRACTNPNTPADERPVFEQEHRVVICNWPDARTHEGRAFLRTLAELQADYPEAIIHLHGTYSWRIAFGMGYAAADIDPHEDAAKGRIVLGNGKYIKHEQGQNFAQWIRLHGFTQGDLATSSNRCKFNIKSALWAGENYEQTVKFKSSGTAPVDPTSARHLPATTKSSRSVSVAAKDGDKVVCDTCTLFSTCKYARVGGVCTVPGTDTAKLAVLFGTRDSDRIIEGLGRVLARQAERFERAADAEEWNDEDGLDAEVTKLGHVLLVDGVKLAKIVNPSLAAAAAPRVGVFVGGQHVHAAPPASLAASVVAELEAQGISRDSITSEMIEEQLTKRQAIEVTAS